MADTESDANTGLNNTQSGLLGTQTVDREQAGEGQVTDVVTGKTHRVFVAEALTPPTQRALFVCHVCFLSFVVSIAPCRRPGTQ